MPSAEELIETGDNFLPMSCCAHMLEDLPFFDGDLRLEDIAKEY